MAVTMEGLAWETIIDLALGRDVENCSPGELGARSTEITEAGYLSMHSGRAEPVWVPPQA